MKVFLWFNLAVWAVATMASFLNAGIVSESASRSTSDVRLSFGFGVVSIITALFAAYTLGGMP